jgi:hypothetical protein
VEGAKTETRTSVSGIAVVQWEKMISCEQGGGTSEWI